MLHVPPLVSTLTIGLVLAFSLGVLAHRLKLPPLVGYLVAGIVIGFPPAVGADQNIANQLSEVGVILLLFGVGLHFSVQDLLSVRAIAIPGAIAQGLVATPLGMAVGWALGWSPAAGFIFGLALSVASTVVLLRMLQERRLLETERGKITIGWLIVQDIAMVLALVLLPAITGLFQGEAPPDAIEMTRQVAEVVGKLLVFTLAMLVVGKKVIPALLHYVAHTGSRELFRLAVLSIALGFAYVAAELFGVSLALGAFFAGMVLSESQLSQQAATESLPLRDAFAVLFFVSVGMLFHPSIMVEEPLAVLATVAIIVIAKSIAAFGVVRLFGQSSDTGLMISASLAQIGEFSFILASLGLALGVLPNEGRDLILAGSIITILLNPLLFSALDRYYEWRDRARIEEASPDAKSEEGEEAEEATPTPRTIPETTLTNHVVLVGHGRVGRFVSKALLERGVPVYIIEDDAEDAADLNANGVEALNGNAADPEVIKSANLNEARCLLVAIPDAFGRGASVEQARAINPKLRIVARAHSEAEIDHLAKHGADFVVMGEHEIGKAMLGELNAQERPLTDAVTGMANAGPIRGR
ncbi:sodium:proton antiporter [Methyloceanibacter methanicus]|uniref:Sodium:proton antiporter n=1 Tax=Methyloceanibacter methanicus TaxID=1774968 RepID=A0A1E3W2I9_9HYPH|nr:YbaL family putative K(+) efflux transporter [Methyloceanibacter methanicus]ODR99990.1 sodium:proton antiporter [Methyloceanibacter methanicus]